MAVHRALTMIAMAATVLGTGVHTPQGHGSGGAHGEALSLLPLAGAIAYIAVSGVALGGTPPLRPARSELVGDFQGSSRWCLVWYLSGQWRAWAFRFRGGLAADKVDRNVLHARPAGQEPGEDLTSVMSSLSNSCGHHYILSCSGGGSCGRGRNPLHSTGQVLVTTTGLTADRPNPLKSWSSFEPTLSRSKAPRPWTSPAFRAPLRQPTNALVPKSIAEHGSNAASANGCR